MCLTPRHLGIGTIDAMERDSTVGTARAPSHRRVFVSKVDPMDKALAAMGAQLELWSLRIDALVARSQRVGVRTGFETLMYIDELKVLHALAKLKLAECLLSRAELDDAWKDLVVAFERPPP